MFCYILMHHKQKGNLYPTNFSKHSNFRKSETSFELNVGKLSYLWFFSLLIYKHFKNFHELSVVNIENLIFDG